MEWKHVGRGCYLNKNFWIFKENPKRGKWWLYDISNGVAQCLSRDFVTAKQAMKASNSLIRNPYGR